MNYTDFLDDNDLKALAQSMNHRAKQANHAGRLSITDLRHRIYASGGQCEWCTVSILKQPFEVDHIIAIVRGGSNLPENIAVSCPTCNRRKSDKHPARFAQETYARTGILTALIQRVFAYYEVEGQIQKSLFEETDDTTTVSISDETPNDDPPPYIWGK